MLVDSAKNNSFFVVPPLVSFLYLPVVLMQELIARGIIQKSLQTQFHKYPHANLRAIILSNILFAVFHTHYTFNFILLSFLSGIIFGFFYIKHENIFSVSPEKFNVIIPKTSAAFSMDSTTNI